MILGIDLGTTNSLVAYYDGNQSHLICSESGDYLTPSVVSFLDNDSVVIGKTAKERAIKYPLRTISTFKRDMGTRREYMINQVTYTPRDLSSLILKSLAEMAHHFLSEPIKDVVISVPAYFNEHQRQDTIDAAKMIGLKVQGLINEPTAAALAYHLHESKDEKMIAVVDLGGGTFDVSILDIFDSIIEVKAVSGDNHLGGEDFDLALLDLIAKKLNINKNTLPLKDRAQLKFYANKFKLEFDHKTSIKESIHLSSNTYEISISHKEFEIAVSPVINRLKDPIRKALRDTGLKLSEIDEVILVGGSTKMPLVKTAIAKMFGKMPLCYLDPDQVVALGAAVFAAMKNDDIELRDTVLTDVCPYTLGIEIHKDLTDKIDESVFDPIIERNLTIPISRQKNYYAKHDHQKQIRLKVYQGESRNPKNNIFLGDLVVEIKPGPTHIPAVSVRFTYDVNGILEVYLKSLTTDDEKKAILLNEKMLSEDEVATCISNIEHLKIHPLDDEENLFIISKAERLYEMFTGSIRSTITDELNIFKAALHSQDPDEISKCKKRILDFFDLIEGY